MKKLFLFCSTLLLLTSLLSCNGQQKATPEKTKSDPSEKTKVAKEDFDPYFAKDQALESTSAPNSITRNILQDSKGNMWFATWQGILKYDGMKFTNLTNTHNLRRFHVFSLLEDSSGNLWFGTIGAGVYRYDGKTFTNFTTEDGLANDKIGCFMEAENGLLWIGTMGGISKFNGTSFSNLTVQGGANNNDVNSIVEDNTGILWIGTRGKAFTYDGNSFTKVITKKEQAFTNVRSIIKDNEGTMWLGGNDGLWSYDGNVFNHHATNFTGYIYQDIQENIWTSSEGAHRKWVLTKYDKKAMADPVQVKNEENMFFGITQDIKGGIWLGKGDGVYRYDGTRFITFKKQPSFITN